MLGPLCACRGPFSSGEKLEHMTFEFEGPEDPPTQLSLYLASLWTLSNIKPPTTFEFFYTGLDISSVNVAYYIPTFRL